MSTDDEIRISGGPHELKLIEPELTNYSVHRWGHARTVEAESVTFTSGGTVVFMTGSRLVLALNAREWSSLSVEGPAQ